MTHGHERDPKICSKAAYLSLVQQECQRATEEPEAGTTGDAGDKGVLVVEPSRWYCIFSYVVLRERGVRHCLCQLGFDLEAMWLTDGIPPVRLVELGWVHG